MQTINIRNKMCKILQLFVGTQMYNNATTIRTRLRCLKNNFFFYFSNNGGPFDQAKIYKNQATSSLIFLSQMRKI